MQYDLDIHYLTLPPFTMAISSNGQTRRTSNPLIARRIWQSIGNLHRLNLPASIDHLVNDLEKDGLSSVDVVNEIGKCVNDRLLSPCKKDGSESEEEWVFNIPPDQPMVHNSKQRDWYCFDCHQAGLVYSCRTCFRSFHKECTKIVCQQLKITPINDNMEKQDWTCPWCQYCKESTSKVEVTQTKQVTERMNACLLIITEELYKEYTV